MAAQPALTRFDVATHDPETAHQLLRDAFCDFDVRPAGSTEGFACRYAGTTVPGFSAARLRYTMASEFDAQTSQTAVLVNLCRGGRLTVAAGREQAVAGPTSPILMPPDEPGWQVEMDDATVDSMAIDKVAVDDTARSLFGAEAPRVRFTSMAPVSAGAGRYWAGTVAHVERDVLGSDEVAAAPLVLAEARRALVTALLVTFPNSGTAALEGRSTEGWAEPAVLRRALAFIDEHAGDDVGVADIALAARIGVRGLQTLFRRERGCTPLEQLRRVRLARAHADLQRGDPTRGDTVAAIAARWGFPHPGRFSVQYRRAYARSPRQTLGS